MPPQRDTTPDAQPKMEQFLMSVERRAYRMAYVATRQREDALDLVQDAMFKLAQRYMDRPPAEWPPLFYRILQSRIRDWVRREKVRRVWLRFTGARLDAEGDAAPDPVEQAAAGVGFAPDINMANERAMEAVEKALRKLPLRQQQAFLLRAWEGLDVAETALAMKCSEGSVKTHYSRAIHALRGMLEGYRDE